MDTAGFIEALRADIKRELREEIREELKQELKQELLDELMPLIEKRISKNLFTSKEAAAYLRVSHGTLWLLMKNKELPHFHIGRRLRFRQSDLDQFIQSKMQKNFPKVVEQNG
ncbi:helix-turn-helix domain-containing protein [Cohnella xylanilytica]|uniref:Helix-turn-helix domain-containing protein n=1 Tax=Cohnella xylanilytica TaxID=557555 RepID=A0A841U2J7_9BACL|nr:helix-turn-helix domain-containing protein [Cohnella xylanilytica]MBB6692341.1 helix-turn-helix domain-containing protein [Cohnella xylanilytica]